MKISELIVDLEEMLEKYGDIDIYSPDEGWEYELTDVGWSGETWKEGMRLPDRITIE